MVMLSGKGISPMIAIVLLIAFTVAIGGILSLWLTGYTTTTTSSVETATTNQTKCAGTYIDVISVANQSILITNRGSETINDIKCYTANGTVVGLLNGGSEDDLSPGAILSSVHWNSTELSSNETGYVSGYGTSVTCSGDCLNIGVTGECKSGQTCWKL